MGKRSSGKQKLSKLPLPPPRLLPGMVSAASWEGVDDAPPPTPEEAQSAAAARRYLGRVAALGCAVCRRLGFPGTPAQVHHPRLGNVGMGEKCSDFDSIPLCREHHTGNTGVHSMGHDEFEQRYGFTEQDLQADTKRLLGEGQ